MANIKEIIGEEAYNSLSEDKRKEIGKKDFEDISGGAFIPKSRFDQVNEQAKEYKKQSEQKDAQLSSLKEQYKDVDGLKEKVETLETTNKTQKETYEKQLSDISFNNALEKGLGTYNVRDKKLIMALIDKDKLKVDGDSVIGLKEQIEPLQKSHEYLFNQEVKGTGTFITGGGEEGQHKETGTEEHIATRLAKQHAEAAKSKGILDFAK